MAGFVRSTGFAGSIRRWPRWLALMLVVVMAGTLAGPGVDGGRSAAQRLPGHGPGQRWGDAAGQSHVEADGRSNAAQPRSLQSKYPPIAGQQDPIPAGNQARVLDSSIQSTPVRGFDAATSRELPEQRGRTHRTFANADGTLTTEYGQDPMHFQRPDGSWQAIDTSLVPHEKGWRNAADSVTRRLAPSANADRTARVVLDDQHQLEFGVDGARASAGQVAGSSVTYPGVRPGADLKLDVTRTGLKESVILHSTDAPQSWLFPLRLTGLTASLVDGVVELRDERGEVRARIPRGFMVDSRVDEHTGEGATSHGVTYALVDVKGQPALRMDLDGAWLADPARVFPVTVDPSVDLRAPSYSGYLQFNDWADPGQQDYSYGSPDELRIGHNRDAAGNRYYARSYLEFYGLETDLYAHKIFDAKLALTNFSSASCNARPLTVHPVMEGWENSTPTWRGPRVDAALRGVAPNFAHGYIAPGATRSACPTATEVINLGPDGVNLVQRWVNRFQRNYGLAILANESDVSAWKRFTSAGTANPPRLSITHSPYNASYEWESAVPTPPVTRTQGGRVKLKVRNLGAAPWDSGYALAYRYFNAHGDYLGSAEAASLSGNVSPGSSVTLDALIQPTPPGTYRFEFSMIRRGVVWFTDEQVPPAVMLLTVIDVPPVIKAQYPPNGYSAPTLTPTLWAQGVDIDASPNSSLQYRFEVCQPGPANCFDSGRRSSTAWPIPFGRLQWGKSYQWRVFAWDGASESPALPFSTLLTAVPQPEITAHLGNAPYGGGAGEFDPQVGNYTTSAIDASVTTVGPRLSVVRTYNSLDPRRDTAFGLGWFSPFDMRATADNDGSGNVVVTYQDGQQVRFGSNRTTSGQPDGAQLVSPPGRHAILVPYIPAQPGSGWSLADKSGTVYVFLPDGKLVEITDSTGRSLALTYGADGKLATATNRTSNRSLRFTWSGSHVTKVDTDPVNGAPLSWTYSYDGDRLTRVCDPTGGCTRYDYTPGTHYRSLVLDSRPDSYWRLGERAGTEAASQVSLNLGADKARYSNVTLGSAGALPGTDDPAATFNGTSSAVVLPDGLVRRSHELTIELWFKTTGNGPLFGMQTKPLGTAPASSVPSLYVGTDGKLRGQLWTGQANPLTTPGAVNDGNWHQVVLSSSVNTQTLYLDGQSVGTRTGVIDNSAFTFSQVGVGQSVPASAWPQWGTTSQRWFTGDIDEVAVYQHPLGVAAVQSHFAARAGTDYLARTTLPSGKVAAQISYDTVLDRLSQYIDHNGGMWTLDAPVTSGDPSNVLRMVRVTDPGRRAHFYEYDPMRGRILRYMAPLGMETRPEDQPPPPPGGGWTPPLEFQGARTFAYDANGFQSTIFDENGGLITLGNDQRGNITSRTTCRLDTTDCQTAYFEYQTGVSDPRMDKLVAARDARSSGPADNRFRTSYTYTTSGLLETQTTPDGAVVQHTYTSASTPAFGGGNAPAGLVETTTDPRHAITRYAYFRTGDLAEIRSPSGLVTRYTYDALGRPTGSTQISDSHPQGITTTSSYDKLGRLTLITGPGIANPVTGVTHTARNTATYDADGNPTRIEESDLTGRDPTRVTQLVYDGQNRLERTTDPEGGETSYGYDAFGNRTRLVNPAGVHFEFAYTARNSLAEVRLRGWNSDPDSAPEPEPTGYLVLASYTYDYAGQLVRTTDAMGRATRYRYYLDGLLRQVTALGFHNPDGTTRDLRLADLVYDGAGNLVKQTRAGGLVSTFEVDAVGRRTATTFDPTGLARRTELRYDLVGSVTQVRMTGKESNTGTPGDGAAEVVDFGYDASGRQTSHTVHTGTEDLTTRWGYDQRGLVTSVTDPRGTASGADPAAFTTNLGYDQLGRPVTVTAPPVSVETFGGQPVIHRPVSTVGYDTFGNATEAVDPNGQTWHSGYDKTGRLTSSTAPSYTPPGAAQPVTATTRLQYDQSGRLVALTGPRGAVSRYSYDQLSRLVERVEPNPDSPADPGIWRYTYTRTGDPLSVTDPTGARVEATYDDLRRRVTTSLLERQPQPGTFTTAFRYDDASNLTNVTAPSNAKTDFAYDLLGQLTKVTKVTSPATVVTQLGYDRAGRHIKTVDAAGRANRTAFDLAGRATTVSDNAPNGSQIRQSSISYDRAGNPATATDPLGHISRITVDALDRPAQLVRPVSPTESITTSYGYDSLGNTTRRTDGRGNSTHYTVNTWGLPESVIEPATTAHPNLDDRRWTTGYDAAGNPVTSTAPGGVRQEASYDELDQLRQVTGAGAELGTTTKTFDYDDLGRLTTSSAPGGTNTFTYNDRGGVLSTTGPSGASGFEYDGDGNLITRTDAAGTAHYGYTNGRLSTMRDGITGATQTLGYNTSGQLSTVDYGGGRTRTFTYDDLARLATDTLATNGTTTAGITYGYDLSNWLTAKTTQGMAGAGSNTYGYDFSGRLTSWTKDGATTNYGWDAANNRTRAGDKTATFDERNRLRSDGTSSYTYTPRGTLASKTTGASTESLSFDAFDRLISQGPTRYAYDALDRVVTRNAQRFAYTGTSNELATDGTTKFGRGPFDELLSLNSGSDNRLAIADQHGDVIGGFNPAATTTALTDSVSFDPFGTPTATTGARRPVGFQGDYTDPDTGAVNMTARWYNPSTGAFLSRDTVDPTNRYTYTYGSPLNYTDPSGQIGCDIRCACAINPNQASCQKPAAPQPPPPSGGGGGGGSGGCGSSSTDPPLDFAPGSGCCGDILDFAPDPGCAGGAIGSGLGSLPGVNIPGMNHAGGVIVTPPPAAQPPPPPPDPAIAARRANENAARNNPLPIPQAMLQPTYGGSSTPPVSSAPDVPSKVAGDFRNDVNDINQSYEELKNSLTVPSETVLGNVKSSTTAPTEITPSGGCPPAVAHQCSIGVALGEAASQIVGFFKGVAAVAIETVKGLLGMVSDIYDCLNPFRWGKCGEHIQSVVDFGKALVSDPIGTVTAIGQAMIQPMVDAWNRGDYGEAIGRGAAELADLLGGTKGLGKVKAVKDAEKAAKGGRKHDGSCSFIGTTEVVMADGTTKPISEIKVGDQILAADPDSGERGPRTVTAVHVHQDTVVDLVTGVGEKVTTTEDHPFWDATDGRWERADQLDPGDDLLTTTGEHIRVVGLRSAAEYVTLAYNLTVDDLHTYYVRTQSTSGGHDLLVHNDCGTYIEDDGYATWVKSHDDPQAYARIEREGDELHVTDLFRRDLPPGSGAEMLAAGLEHMGVRPGQHVVISNIINKATQDGFHNGMDPRQSVLGKSATNALSTLGLRVASMEWQYDMSGTLNIVITVG